MRLVSRRTVLAAALAADLALLGWLGRTLADRVQRSGAAVSQTALLQAEKPEEAKFAALTFDDGPDSRYTPLLLDGLRERGIRASFFLMGERIPGNEELVRRMKREGHLIGNHGYRHEQLTHLRPEQAWEEIERTNRLLEEITGERPRYLRPPYGAWNEGLENQLDMTSVFWSVDSLDWELQDKKRIVERVLKDLEDGDMILMHDIFSTSVEAALELADRLTAEGYLFVTADELLIE